MSRILARIVTEVTQTDDGRVTHATWTEPLGDPSPGDPGGEEAAARAPADHAAAVGRHRDRLSALRLNADERTYLLYLAQRPGETVLPDQIRDDVFGDHPHPGRKWGNVQSGLNRRYTARGWGEVVHWDGTGYVMDAALAAAVHNLYGAGQ